MFNIFKTYVSPSYKEIITQGGRLKRRASDFEEEFGSLMRFCIMNSAETLKYFLFGVSKLSKGFVAPDPVISEK